MKKMMFCLKIGFFSSKSLNLLYSQQISPQFMHFISISTCGEFHTCGEFYISYSTIAYSSAQGNKKDLLGSDTEN